MSGRPGFVVDHRVPADGGESPNAYVAQVSVQVRCNWPPLATQAQVVTALADACLEAIAEFQSHERRPSR